MFITTVQVHTGGRPVLPRPTIASLRQMMGMTPLLIEIRETSAAPQKPLA